MKNILVTGANGQLGNEMRRIALKGGCQFYFTDAKELDITDQQAIMQYTQLHPVDAVANCAAYTNVDKAEDEPETADLINHIAVEHLAEACLALDATLFHISTDYVFKGDLNIPCVEEQPTHPLGVYGATKLAGEQSIQKIGCKHLIFRTAWLYSSFGANFVKTMKRLTAEKESLQVVFDQVGTPTYAADLADVIYELLMADNYNNHQGIYHFSNEGVCSWYDFAVEIAALCGNSCAIAPCHSNEFPSKVTRPPFSVLDKTKIKQTFGLVIPHWKASLKECILQLHES